MPMFSILIPAYNEEEYLPNCLESLQSQTYQNFEVIVIDNHSTDNTSRIPAKFGYRVISENRKGVSFVRNTGAKISKGEILFFLDSDCTLPADYLEKVVSFLTLHQGISALGGPYIYLDSNKFVKFLTQTCHYFSWYFKFLKFISGYQILPGGNFVIRKNVFQKLNGFNLQITNIVHPEDAEFSIRLQKAQYKIYYSNEFFVYSSYRRHTQINLKNIFIRFYLTLKLLFSSN